MSIITTAASAGLVRHVRDMDKVVLAILAMVLALAALTPEQAAKSLRFTGGALLNIFPYLLLSVTIAGAVTAIGLNGSIARVFSSHGGKAIVASALIGYKIWRYAGGGAVGDDAAPLRGD